MTYRGRARQRAADAGRAGREGPHVRLAEVSRIERTQGDTTIEVFAGGAKPALRLVPERQQLSEALLDDLVAHVGATRSVTQGTEAARTSRTWSEGGVLAAVVIGLVGVALWTGHRLRDPPVVDVYTVA